MVGNTRHAPIAIPTNPSIRKAFAEVYPKKIGKKVNKAFPITLKITYAPSVGARAPHATRRASKP